MFQDNLLAGKTVLITGGGTGLGKTMGGRFMELGADVIICGRRAEVLETTAKEWEDIHGRAVHRYPLDIRKAEAIEEMLDDVWPKARPNVLVNNAAGNFVARTHTLSPRAFDSILNIVAHGSAYMSLGVGKRWIAEGTPGTILCVLVTAAWTGAPYVVPSAMAKAAVMTMVRSLAVEWGPKGIRTVGVAPGPFPTKGAWSRLYPREGLDRQMEVRPPLGRPGKHEEFGNFAAYLVSDQAGYINGDIMTIDGGNWLKKASGFSDLDVLSDAEWDEIGARKPGKGGG